MAARDSSWTTVLVAMLVLIPPTGVLLYLLTLFTGSPFVFIIGMVAVAVIALAIAARMTPGPTPEEVREEVRGVMERKHPERKAYIDALVRLGDCAALRAAQEVVTHEHVVHEDAPHEVTDYIRAAWKKVGCRPLDYTFDDTRRFMAYHYPDRKAEIDDLADRGDLAALAAAWRTSSGVLEPRFISEYIDWLMLELAPGEAENPDAPGQPNEVEIPQPNRLSILSERDPDDR